MATAQTNLWPDFKAVDIITPVTILRQQAALLEKKTNGLVVAEVRSGIDYGSNTMVISQGQAVPLLHTFYLIAPALENYRYQLFRIKQSIDLYPIEFKDSPCDDVTVTNESEFYEELKKIFASEKTKKMIELLIAQSSS